TNNESLSHSLIFCLIILLTILISLSRCKNSDTVTNNDEIHTPGQLFVSLEKDCDYDTAKAILSQPDAEILDLHYWFTFYSYSSDIDTILNALFNDGFIEWVWKLAVIEIEKQQVTPILFKTENVSTMTYYMDLINSFDDIDSTVVVEAEFAVVSVPIGEEYIYVNLYNNLRQKYPDIKCAGVDPIVIVNCEGGEWE
ncbi:hypothetical protein ACFLT7_08510, partial [candidate division KSB1 bacterium]